MKKIIKIEEKEVVFEFNAATPILYKQEFKTDFYADMAKMSKAAAKGGVTKSKNTKIDMEKMDYEDFDYLGVEQIMRLVWAEAASAKLKTGETMLPPLQWAAQFECIPSDVYTEVMEMAAAGMQTKKK